MSEPAPLPKPPSPHCPPAPTMARQWYVRAALQVLAVLSLVLGIVGIFVPGLPTTVFILIAGWAAMRSSPRMHAWLWQHKLFGPMLQNWQAGGFVSRRAKRSATFMMAICAAVLWLVTTPLWVRIFACSCMVAVLIWLWQRPEPEPAP
ncbi:MAG: YbaN family protein [Comamonas sp.]|nr:YbaN family protein [Comamonas sp.]